ncbi:hypothetical protein [Methylobacterium durans]|uniref:Uncharacterized protein n=1 Tax=Methylobacterium durans TaxID=2202825 RepID=A0A2U8WBE6_9HYPH|nr:hypothetical protein [Methylobacterium durans]AWN43484.1 hypothetical protein DK389_26975 [Methylobacterium durans]
MADRDPPSNTVVPFERRTVAPADPNNLLRVERLLREHGRSVARTYLPTLRAIDPRDPSALRSSLIATHREALEVMLAGAASVHALEAISEALDRALSAEPDEGAVEASLAALIDSRMRLPHNLPIFVEAAIFDLVDLGFPPTVVAAACEKLRRESTYFPEISEIVAACRETLARYRDQRRRVAQALADRRQAERWLADLTESAATGGGTVERLP